MKRLSWIMICVGVAVAVAAFVMHHIRKQPPGPDLMGSAVGPVIAQEDGRLSGPPVLARDGRAYFLFRYWGSSGPLSLAAVSESSSDVFHTDPWSWSDQCGGDYELISIASRREGGLLVSARCPDDLVEGMEVDVLDPVDVNVARRGRFPGLASVGSLSDGTNIAVVRRLGGSCHTLARSLGNEWKDQFPAGNSIVKGSSEPVSAEVCLSEMAEIIGSDGVAMVYVRDALTLAIVDLSSSRQPSVVQLPFVDIEGAVAFAGTVVVSGRHDNQEGLWSFDVRSQSTELLWSGEFSAPSWILPGQTILIGQSVRKGMQLRRVQIP